MRIGTDYLRDPVEEAVAGLQRESDRRRLPDPPRPDGSPILVPVHTPVEAPPRRQRMAAGAEGMDISKRLAEFQSKPTEGSKLKSPVRGLLDWGQGGGA